MDFFGHQEQARKASKRLVWLFATAVICIVALIYIAAKALLVTTELGEAELVDWPLLGAVAGLVIVVVGGAMLFKTAQLRGGGSAVAEMMGGRRVEIDTKDPQERVLRNVVEEMAIASGVPVPDVFVLDGEMGINAFAAGWSPADAAVAVTQGSLEQFTRDELQGVIAHEFSHVFHGDMRLNIRLMGTLFGITCIAIVGRILMRGGFYSGATRSNNRRDGGQAIMFFGIALIVIGYVGVFFARLIQAAVSRQREYLADASAVQYTRNPRGIGMALAKIGGIGGKMRNPHAEETSHMMFANAVSRMGGSMATHPPLETRIERVLPGFMKHFEGEGSMAAAAANTPLPPEFAGAAAGFAGGGAMAATTPAATAAPAAAPAAASASRFATSSTPSKLLGTIGDPQPQHVEAARRLLDALPLDLTVAAHEPARAPSLVYALLLDPDAEQRDAQLELLENASPQVRHDTQAIYLDVARLERALRLPLLELTMPALRSLPHDQRRHLRERARALALADDHLSPFEFALIKSLERHVRNHDEEIVRPRGRPQSLLQCKEEAALVLSVIAHAGAEGDRAKAESAFARGTQALSLADVRLVDSDRAKPAQLDHAIAALAKVSPFGKRNLITACAEVAADDGVLDPDEVDLVRALGELWDCPVPLATSV